MQHIAVSDLGHVGRNSEVKMDMEDFGKAYYWTFWTQLNRDGKVFGALDSMAKESNSGTFKKISEAVLLRGGGKFSRTHYLMFGQIDGNPVTKPGNPYISPKGDRRVPLLVYNKKDRDYQVVTDSNGDPIDISERYINQQAVNIDTAALSIFVL